MVISCGMSALQNNASFQGEHIEPTFYYVILTIYCQIANCEHKIEYSIVFKIVKEISKKRVELPRFGMNTRNIGWKKSIIIQRRLQHSHVCS